MRHFFSLFRLGLKRRSKDFFVLFYNVVFPIVIIALLGYLTSKSYGTNFTSYNYYTIVIIPFCTLMGISSISYASQDEKNFNTSYRYMTAPISKLELVTSKFFSCVIMLSLCNVLVLGISTVLFKMSFNGSFLFIILLLICESVAVTGIGLLLGLTCRNLDILRNVINIPIVISGFLGGVFFPVASLNPILATIINMSPLTWIKHSIVTCIYEGHTNLIFSISFGFVIIGILTTTLSIKLFKKEVFI